MMNESSNIPKELADLVDGYLADHLSQEQFQQLEDWLKRDEAARQYFTLYCKTHTDIHVELRARRASRRAMAAVATEAAGHVGPATLPILGGWKRWKSLAAVAAVLLVSVTATWWATRWAGESAGHAQEVAWLANAQDCRWATDASPDGRLSKGGVIRLERGLAELRFRSGAAVVLEGPATLEMVSFNSARLLSGKLSARVTGAAKGFQVLTPQGRVVDLGTEFGISVSNDGSADVVVFSGKVEAFAAGNAAPTSLTENRTARIGTDGVVVNPGGSTPAKTSFARRILPVPFLIPRTLTLDFSKPMNGTLKDGNGTGTGFEQRLPGTGIALPENDRNIHLDPLARLLSLTTTRSDINTQYHLNEGEYLGVRLSKLGFTGTENFEVTAIIPNIPSLAAVGQFGLYVGSRSDRNIRGGLISSRQPEQYKQFLVNNNGGRDDDALYVGLFPTGSDTRLTLQRIDGKYRMSVESLSSGASSTLAIRHPEFLDKETDLNVGLFASNIGSEERRTITLKEFRVTVWTQSDKAGTSPSTRQIDDAGIKTNGDKE